MLRIGWLLLPFASAACLASSTGTSDYATAGAFAATAGALEVVDQTRKPPRPAPCGRPALACPDDARTVCVTDGAGCQLCSCERTGFGPGADDRTWPQR